MDSFKAEFTFIANLGTMTNTFFSDLDSYLPPEEYDELHSTVSFIILLNIIY